MMVSPPAPSSAERICHIATAPAGSPGGGCFCTHPGAGGCGEGRRLSGHRRGIAPVSVRECDEGHGFAPPIFFGACPKKTGRARSKRKALFGLCTQRLTGDSSDGSDQTRKSPTGCAIHRCRFGTAPPQVAGVRWSSRWKTERPVLLCPRVPLRYAHTRAVA